MKILKGMVPLLFISALVACTGCQSIAPGDIDEMFGVAPGENAALCVEGTVDPAWTESRIDIERNEGPAAPQVSALSPEQIRAMAELTSEQIKALMAVPEGGATCTPQ